MSTRREFLKKSTAAGIVIATSTEFALAGDALISGANASQRRGAGQRRREPRIKTVFRRDETTLRLGGNGDNFHMTWAPDSRQLVAVCDGFGWSATPNKYFNSRLYAIDGGPSDARFRDIETYPELTGVLNTDNLQRYYGFGTLAFEGHIYQFLSTPNHRFIRPGLSPWPNARFLGAKLIYSPDNGRTWCNQDGSTPVTWEAWSNRSKENMVFFEEPEDAFSLLSVVQMGKGYSANKDGYVYVYSPNGNTDGTMNQLVLFRVPKSSIRQRREYEYFAGLRSDGSSNWVKSIDERAVVHTFPRGWVNTSIHPWAWMPSITYNQPLDLYMMASWGMGCAPDGSWFGKPSYLGLWVSKSPWGPWDQIHEETAWTPQDDLAARAFAPQIAPKWISQDGKSIWLVWSDFKNTGTDEEVERLLKDGAAATSNADTVRFYQMAAKIMPHYAFNAQRVDLVVA